MTHICVSDLTIIGSDNGLSPGRRQAIIRTNAGILLIRPLGTNFSEFLIEILIFSLKKMRLKVSSAKRRPFCLGPNVLSRWCVSHKTIYDYSSMLYFSDGFGKPSLEVGHGLSNYIHKITRGAIIYLRPNPIWVALKKGPLMWCMY